MTAFGKIQIGELVCSKAGRDTGRYYIVLEIEKDTFLWLIDGRYRKSNNAKRKNYKHIRRTGLIAEDLVQKLQKGKKPTNTEVRKAISDLVEILEGDSRKTRRLEPDGEE